MFVADTTSNPTFNFDTVGGYRIILSFLGSSTIDRSKYVLQQFLQLQQDLDLLDTIFFGVTIDPEDLSSESLIENRTYFKLVWDFDCKISNLYGVCSSKNNSPEDEIEYRSTTFVLSQNLQILGILPIQDPVEHLEQIAACLKQIPTFEPPQRATRQAPVLLIPHVFDRDFCRHLIDLYEADGGSDSGFMRERDGKTIEVLDASFKKRRDFKVVEPVLLQKVNDLILSRIKPEIEKVFQFSITRFERHLVACYEAHNQGFFNRHRDNTTKGTAHRRFAMSLNLNTDEYEGGELWFPEYGSQRFKPEVGEAVIFSCSLLHEATPVTSGRRFVLLSFFYNDEDANLRQRNLKYIETKEDAQNSDPAPAHPAKAKGFQRQLTKSGKKRR
jgi:predicted 2-oxoglutarate/Fe(II)-dependent dioxygenase YbiX/peroxiredoxin